MALGSCLTIERLVGDDETVAHADDAVAAGADLRVVGDEDRGLAALAVEAAEQRQDLGRSGPSRGCRSARPPAGSARPLTSARAIATRCCSPPEAPSAGAPPRSVEADRCRALARPPVRVGAAGRPRTRPASATFSRAVSVGTRLNDWNTKPIDRARIGSARRRTRVDVDARRTGVSGAGPSCVSGAWSRPRRCIRVLLPEPDGPMIATISPASMLTSTPRSASMRVPARQPVGLAQIGPSSSVHRRSSSLVAQRGDRVEPGGAPGGDDAGDHAEDRAEADGEDRGAGGEVEEDGAAERARPRWPGRPPGRRGASPISPPMSPMSPPRPRARG